MNCNQSFPIVFEMTEVEEKKVGAYVPIHKRKGNTGAPIGKLSPGGKSGGNGDNQLSEKDKKIKNLNKVSKFNSLY